MDLSGIIFAGLAVAWAVYLIPKALRHHDEMAQSRSVDRFSHTLRVLGRHGSPDSRPEPRQAASPQAPAAAAEAAPARRQAAGPVRHTVTRASARRAAARRRRVLGALLLTAAVLAGLAWRAVVPWWSLAVPGAMILLFLVVARISVRRQQSRLAPALADEAVAVEDAEEGREDTVEVAREELAAAVAAPLEDEGSLWDPLPLTLPTYVQKARARRTVRTIELTQAAGVTSSGHDAADSALVAAAEETRAPETVEERKVAGA